MILFSADDYDIYYLSREASRFWVVALTVGRACRQRYTKPQCSQILHFLLQALWHPIHLRYEVASRVSVAESRKVLSPVPEVHLCGVLEIVHQSPALRAHNSRAYNGQ